MQILNIEQSMENLYLLYKSHKKDSSLSNIDKIKSSYIFNNYEEDESKELRYKSVFFNDELAIYDDIGVSQNYTYCTALLVTERDGTSFYFIARTKEEEKTVDRILDAHFKSFFDSINEKHPKICQAVKLKYKSTDIVKNFNIYSYYNDLLKIKKNIKGKKVTELLNLLKDQFLRNLFFFSVCKKEMKDNQKNGSGKKMGFFGATVVLNYDDNNSFTGYQKITNDDFNNSQEYCNLINFIENVNFERINDFATHLEMEASITSLIKSISSSKDRHLFNDDSRLFLQNIISIYKENNIDKISSYFHKNFSNKIAKYKTTDELNNSLQSYSNILSNWDINLWIQKYKHLPITYQRSDTDSNILIIKVSDFKTMSIIGSPQWCIATDKSHFFEYSVRGYATQYILLDFNKALYDFDSMIGVTLDQFSHITHMHDKNDGCLMYLECFFFIEELMPKINPSEIKTSIIDNLIDLHQNLNTDDFKIDLFKELSFYNMQDSEEFNTVKKWFISKCDNAPHEKDGDLMIASYIERLILTDISSLNVNNISNIEDIFSALKQSTTDINILYNFNIDISKSSFLIRRENGDSFTNLYIENAKLSENAIRLIVGSLLAKIKNKKITKYIESSLNISIAKLIDNSITNKILNEEEMYDVLESIAFDFNLNEILHLCNYS
jgi:hypothetical protein